MVIGVLWGGCRGALGRGAPLTPRLGAGERLLENVAGRPRLDSLSSVEEDDYDTLADIDYDKNVIRTKVPPALPPCPTLPCPPAAPHQPR